MTGLEEHEPQAKAQQESFMSKLAANSPGSSDLASSQIFPELVDDEPEFSTPEADEYTPESYDEYLQAQVILPVGGELRRGQMIRRKKDHQGQPIGIQNTNPILDMREYEIQFPDGSSGSYLANTIAENLYSQVDQEGRSYVLL
ncbi:MAG: hypothetical protein ACK55I_35060, partial [bacterium]